MLDQKEYNKIVQETDIAVKKGWDRTKVEWRAAALEIIYKLCVQKEEFTANEFTEPIKKMLLKTHDNRAIGGLIRVAQKFNWVRKTGRDEISKAGHLLKIQVWKSLLYRKHQDCGETEITPPDMSWHVSKRGFMDLGKGKFVINGARGKQYRVFFGQDGSRTCECPDFIYHKNLACKHIRIIQKYLTKKQETEAAKLQTNLF